MSSVSQDPVSIEEAKKTIESEQRLRVETCMKEVSASLEKNRCRFEMSVVLKAMSDPVFNLDIVPSEQQ